MGDGLGQNRYWADVDPAADNNAHAWALELVGQGKRVLELGPAAGHVTRVLVERGCEVVGIEHEPEAAAALEGIAECLVGDLADPTTIAKAAEGRVFDVVLAGDVLEHLPDPTAVLRACRDVLTPGGYVVLSVPNIAHADVALALLDGRFRYNETGLLDRTHLRFFTRDTIVELLERTGFQMIDLRRVLCPIFSTELGVDPSDYPPEVIAHVRAHPEAQTYQFVVRAVPHSGHSEVTALANRCLEVEEALHRERLARAAAEADLAKHRAVLDERDQELAQQVALHEAETANFRHQISEYQKHLDSIFSSRSMRVLAPFRAVYAKLRDLAR